MFRIHLHDLCHVTCSLQKRHKMHKIGNDVKSDAIEAFQADFYSYILHFPLTVGTLQRLILYFHFLAAFHPLQCYILYFII